MRPARLALLLLTAFVVSGQILCAAPTHELLASFGDPPVAPGLNGLTKAPDGYFWGTTQQGGASFYDGTVIRMKPDGSFWETVLSFVERGTVNRGSKPQSSLVYDGAGFLWGTTTQGGAHSVGTLFKIEVATHQLTTVFEFTNATQSPGYLPAALMGDGAGFLWGSTLAGGPADAGSIFKVELATGQITWVVTFTGRTGAFKGDSCGSSLVLDHGLLWGVTATGGAGNFGTVFTLNPGTGAFNTLVEFTGASGAFLGSDPRGPLWQEGGFFWGVTTAGGLNDCGTIFKVNAITHALETVVKFDRAQATDPSAPTSGLIGAGGFLWGTTTRGGAKQEGVVFKINPVNGSLVKTADFDTGTLAKTATPAGLLTPDGAGGLIGFADRGFEVLVPPGMYRVNISKGTAATLFEFRDGGSLNRGVNPSTGIVYAPETPGGPAVWGVTPEGGKVRTGTIFKVDLATGVKTTVYDFPGDSFHIGPSEPKGGLFHDGAGNLWGTTTYGASNKLLGQGVIFKLRLATGVVTSVYNFHNSEEDQVGVDPQSALMLGMDGLLWGTTSSYGRHNDAGFGGGTSASGTIYKLNPTSHAVSRVAGFGGTYHPAPDPTGLYSSQMLRLPDGTLWATTALGGPHNRGTIYKIPYQGTPTTVYEFQVNSDVSSPTVPTGALVSDGNGFLWGLAKFGGPDTMGTVYKIDLSNDQLIPVAYFGSSQNGMAYPAGDLVFDGQRTFYGMTRGTGGVDNDGSIFRVDRLTGVVSRVLSFTGNGAQDLAGSSAGFGGLLFGNDGNLYGATPNGGPGGAGTVFRLRFGPSPTTLAADERTPSSARLQGTLNPHGVSSAAFFDWGTSPTNLSNSVEVSGGPFTGTGPVPVSAVVQGLTANQRYYFRLRGENAEQYQPQVGTVLSFTADTVPVAQSDAIFIRKAGVLAVTANDSDADGDTLGVISTSTPPHGVVSLRNGVLTYKPDVTFAGSDEFTYTISDGHGGEASATVTVTNPFSFWKGTFVEVVTQAGVPAGSVTATITAAGVVTGKLLLGGVTFTLTGSAGYDGVFTQTFHPRGLPDVVVQLTFAKPGALAQMSGSVSGGYDIAASAVAFAALPPEIEKGAYTLLLPPDADSTHPRGIGSAKFTLAATGLGTFTGTLGDNVTFTAGVRVASDGTIALYAPLYTKPKGSLSGTLTFQPGGTFGGSLAWTKPHQDRPSGLFDQFTATSLASGALYHAPDATHLALVFTAAPPVADLHLREGGLANLDAVLDLHTRDAIAVEPPNPGKIACKIDRVHGLFSGSFTPAGKRPIAFKGALQQSENRGGGVFPGTDGTGSVTLVPR